MLIHIGTSRPAAYYTENRFQASAYTASLKIERFSKKAVRDKKNVLHYESLRIFLAGGSADEGVEDLRFLQNASVKETQP